MTKLEGRTAKYLSRGHEIRTERTQVLASREPKNFFVQPDLTQLTSISYYNRLEKTDVMKHDVNLRTKGTNIMKRSHPESFQVDI